MPVGMLCNFCVDIVHVRHAHSAAVKDPQERERVADWIASLKGDRTGDQFAADIAATTGWSVDRTQASRYAKGSIPIGRQTIARFAEYAKAKGMPPLDMTPPAPPLSLEERAVLAAERQATALELIAYHIMGGTAPDRAGLDAMQAMFEQVRSTYRPPRPGPAPVAGR